MLPFEPFLSFLESLFLFFSLCPFRVHGLLASSVVECKQYLDLGLLDPGRFRVLFVTASQAMAEAVLRGGGLGLGTHPNAASLLLQRTTVAAFRQWGVIFADSYGGVRRRLDDYGKLVRAAKSCGKEGG